MTKIEEALKEIIRLTGTSDNPYVLGLANSILVEHNHLIDENYRLTDNLEMALELQEAE